MDLLSHTSLAGLQKPPSFQASKSVARPSFQASRANEVGFCRYTHRPNGNFLQPERPLRTVPRPLPLVRATKTTKTTAEQLLQPGDLVEFSKDRERSGLGLVQGPDGKKNIWVVEGQTLRRSSISPRQVIFRLPGGPYIEAQLKELVNAAAADESSIKDAASATSGVLADAWEMAVADAIPSLSLSDLAGLVLEDETVKNLYRMYRMLASDRLYFKQLSSKTALPLDLPTYEPRSASQVEIQREALAAEARVREDEAAWGAAVRAALAARRRSEQPSPEDWVTGRHAKRVLALKELATKDVGPLTPDVLSLAQQSLALAGIAPPPAAAQGDSEATALSEAAVSLLVDMRAWRRHEPVAALRRGVDMAFPAGIEREAQAILDNPPPDSCASIRIDLTNLPCYTIDDQGTTEVDDGVSVEYLDEGDSLQGSGSENLQGQGETVFLPGSVRLWVHVADPTRWLRPRGAIMDVAQSRSRTLYFPWGSVPMFPRALAEGPFSLRSGEHCDAMSVGVVLSPDGSIRHCQIVPTRVKVSHGLTYDEADQIIAQGTESAAPEMQCAARDLQLLRRAADLRKQYRDDLGCIEIPLPEAKIRVPEAQLDSGRPAVSLSRISQWESPSRGMVAELMILAGEGAGSLGSEAGLALPYRGQPEPLLPKNGTLEAIPAGVCRGYALRRCMTRSGVSPAPMRHASLALGAYVQVTSPIRRWADIVAHFNLKAWLLGQPAPFSKADIEAINTAASSDRIRDFGAAERQEEQYWIAEYFRQRQSSHPNYQYTATVLGWQREDLKLAAMLLEETGLETVVKVDVPVRPGDLVQLGLLEARPVSGLLRFYVIDYLTVGGVHEEEDDNAESGGVADAAHVEMSDEGEFGDGEDFGELSMDEMFAQMEAAEAAAQKVEEPVPA